MTNETAVKSRPVWRHIDPSVTRMLAVLVVVFIGGCIAQPDVFPTVSTFQSVCKQLVDYGLLALGVAICMMSGGIDLSLVYLANLAAIVTAQYLKATIGAGTSVPAPVIMAGGIVIALAIGLLGGLFNGFLVGKLRLPAMLATLGSGQLFMGCSLIITRGTTVNRVPPVFSPFASTQFLGIPLIFYLFVAITAILWYFMDRTKYGLWIYSMGTSSKAAVFSGLSEVKTLLITYGVAGLLAAVSGFVSLSRMNSAKADFGSSYVLLTILLSVLGGTNPDGGKGSIVSVGIAVFIMQMISSLFNMFGSVINVFYRNLVWGALLIIILIVNHYLDRNRALRPKV